MASTKKAGAGKPGAGGTTEAEDVGGGRKKKVVAVVAGALLAGGGGAGWFVLGPGAGAEAAEEEPAEEVELGEVLVVDPISINLADGRYLKLGLGLQVVAEVEEEPSGSKALDAAISLYSGRSMAELSDPVQRDALKEELTKTVAKTYHDEIVDVYFTEYVMQ